MESRKDSFIFMLFSCLCSVKVEENLKNILCLSYLYNKRSKKYFKGEMKIKTYGKILYLYNGTQILFACNESLDEMVEFISLHSHIKDIHGISNDTKIIPKTISSENIFQIVFSEFVDYNFIKILISEYPHKFNENMFLMDINAIMQREKIISDPVIMNIDYLHKIFTKLMKNVKNKKLFISEIFSYVDDIHERQNKIFVHFLIKEYLIS